VSTALFLVIVVLMFSFLWFFKWGMENNIQTWKQLWEKIKK